MLALYAWHEEVSFVDLADLVDLAEFADFAEIFELGNQMAGKMRQSALTDLSLQTAQEAP